MFRRYICICIYTAAIYTLRYKLIALLVQLCCRLLAQEAPLAYHVAALMHAIHKTQETNWIVSLSFSVVGFMYINKEEPTLGNILIDPNATASR